MASGAEREIRDALVDWWHKNEPRARIVHELPLSGFSAEGRADMAAVFTDTLVLIEIKSEKDKLTRLEKQFNAMASRSHNFFIVAHEKWFCERDYSPALIGQEWMRSAHKDHLWRYPATDQRGARWEFNRYVAPLRPHPSHLLDMLWANELRAAYTKAGAVGSVKGLTSWQMVSDLYQKMTGRQVAEFVCRALRARTFAEADAPILESGK